MAKSSKGQKDEGYRSQGSGRLISDRYRAELEGDAAPSRKSLGDHRRRDRGSKVQVGPVASAGVIVAAIAVVLGGWAFAGRSSTPPPAVIDTKLEQSIGITRIWAFGAVRQAHQDAGTFPPAGWPAEQMLQWLPETARSLNYTRSPYSDAGSDDEPDFVYYPAVPSYEELERLDRSKLIFVVDRAALEQGVLVAAFLDGDTRRISRDDARALLELEENAWLERELGFSLAQLAD
ncbi:MAG: hypothetical protein AAGI30_05505 [Planctomycetota bacterium]